MAISPRRTEEPPPKSYRDRSVVARLSNSRAFSKRRFSVLLTPKAVHVTTSCRHNLLTSSVGPEVTCMRAVSSRASSFDCVFVFETYYTVRNESSFFVRLDSEALIDMTKIRAPLIQTTSDRRKNAGVFFQEVNNRKSQRR